MWLLLIGLFCFLLVVGFFVTGGENPFGFAVMALVVLAALGFMWFISVILQAMLFPH